MSDIKNKHKIIDRIGIILFVLLALMVIIVLHGRTYSPKVKFTLDCAAVCGEGKSRVQDGECYCD